uniref:Indoleamine 2,3-dioxygenase 1 n=1 Tax=Leptobrachium leishanense TaxID=445787 RepID=A0A8C5MRG4_9ANUR
MKVQDFATFKLSDYNISDDYGFILQEPLMPELGIQHLKDYKEKVLARVLLSHIVMGYVWQDADQGVVKVLPRTLAIPYCHLSKILGLPLIMVHADFVLANWKRKDALGPLTMENLSTIVSLPGGNSLQGFVLVTLLVEVAAIPGIKAVVQAIKALLTEDRPTLLQALRNMAQSIQNMGEALQLMYDYVDSDIYYNTIRIFLSGWKDNPSMPNGLLYEGAVDEPLCFSGGSAAQSTVFHVYDELFGINHQPESFDFLLKMRQYMPPAHSSFIDWVKGVPKLSVYVQQSADLDLLSAFNMCVSTLTDVRSLHIRIVSKYVTTAGARARVKGLAAGSGAQHLQERGTGGSLAMTFLKSVRDTCKGGLLKKSTAADC